MIVGIWYLVYEHLGIYPETRTRLDLDTVMYVSMYM